MVNPNSLIFEGLYVYKSSNDIKESYPKIYDTLIEFMQSEGYLCTTAINYPISYRRYFTLKFTLNPINVSDLDMTLRQKMMKFFGQSHKVISEQAQHWMASRRQDLSYEVDIRFEIEGKQIFLYVLSISMACRLISKNAINCNKINKEQYEIIKSENIRFLKSLMSSIHAVEVEPIKSKNAQVKFPLSDRLTAIGYAHLGQLLDKGCSKIDDLRLDDGLSDLRSAAEKIIYELVIKIGEKPHDSSKIFINIDVLYTKGFINKKMKNLLKAFDFLYNQLSELPTHDRDKSDSLTYSDAKFCFDLFEICLKYILDKVEGKS